jgi:MFS family permease
MASLFFGNFSILLIGFGLFPLLPIYAADFGATPTMIGMYLAVTYIAISLGTMLVGWIPARVPRKLVFAAAGALGVPAVFLLGYATTLWHVVVLTSLVWFTGGVGLSLINVLVGLKADDGKRGKWFSLISLTTPLGAILGSAVVGWLVAVHGYPTMFAVLTVIYAVWPVLGFWSGSDTPRRTASPVPSKGVVTESAGAPGRMFSFLLITVLLSAVTISISRLGLSLSMKADSFSPAEISAANMVGGLICIPVVFGFGALSDRLGRRVFLTLGYLLGALSGLVLIFADQLWHYWFVAGAVLIARSISASLASALATDILEPKAISRGLPWLGTMTWVAGVMGFAGSGYIIDAMGVNSLYWIATALSVGAAGLMSVLPKKRTELAGKPKEVGVERILPAAKPKTV